MPGIVAVPDESNARYFHVVSHLCCLGLILKTFGNFFWQEVTGPAESPFEGGKFKLELFLPEDYPMSAPKVNING